MKKIISLLLAFILVIMAATVSFAAQEDTTIPDPGAPGSPARNVDTITYDEPDIEIIDSESIPAGSSSTSLPKTGGIPAEVFYAAGALIVLAGLVLSIRKPAAKKR